MATKRQPVGGRHGVRWMRRAILGIVVFFCCLAAGGAALGGGLSLQTTDEPLLDVLDDLSRMTGKKFLCDKAWADLPITVQFKNLALETALKRILANLNHAIIYQADDTILIRIYERVEYAGDTAAGTGGVGIAAEAPSGHMAVDVSLPEEPSPPVDEGEQVETEEAEAAPEDAVEASEPDETAESAEPAEEAPESEKPEAAEEAPESTADDTAEAPEGGTTD